MSFNSIVDFQSNFKRVWHGRCHFSYIYGVTSLVS